jgi:16S rRNA (uracil1498-N3)-methyltransferase
VAGREGSGQGGAPVECIDRQNYQATPAAQTPNSSAIPASGPSASSLRRGFRRVNLILFAASEIDRALPRTDRRAQHLLEVLRRQVGDTFDAGVIDGARGKATVTAITATELTFTFAAATPPSPPTGITLVVGLTRPQTARDILRDTTTLGVGALHFVRTEKTEPSYAQSNLWQSDEWRRHVIAGAEQAFDPGVPQVTTGRTIAETISALPATGTRIALDNYEASQRLGAVADLVAPVTLAIGAERGWSGAERALFRAHGFTLAHLGTRVLRTETACVAALTLLRAKLGLM